MGVMAGCPVVAMSPRARPAVHEGVVYVIDKQDQGVSTSCSSIIVAI